MKTTEGHSSRYVAVNISQSSKLNGNPESPLFHGEKKEVMIEDKASDEVLFLHTATTFIYNGRLPRLLSEPNTVFCHYHGPAKV